MNALPSYLAMPSNAERFDELKAELIALPAFRLDAWGTVGVDAVAEIPADDFIAVGQALMQVYSSHVDGMLMHTLKGDYLSSTTSEQVDALREIIRSFTPPAAGTTSPVVTSVPPALSCGGGTPSSPVNAITPRGEASSSVERAA